MKKIITTIILALALVIGVVGCNNDSDNENNNKNEKQEGLGVGDSSEFKRDTAAAQDHIKLTVNSVELVNEFNGFTPEEDQFLQVNVTLEDLSGYDLNYDEFHVPNTVASGGSRYGYVKDEEAVIIEDLDDGITSIDVIYDVPENETYKLSFGDGKYELHVNE